MQHKSQTIKLKRATVGAAADGKGTFEGYASIFGNRDLGGDVVQKGAFTKTVREHKGKFPLLKDHNFTLDGRLGYVECSEDAKGLLVKGVFNLECEGGREAYSHVKQAIEAEMPLGMSFGYDVIQSHYDSKSGSRMLTELKLYEATLTQFPMNPSAGVTSVKAEAKELRRNYTTTNFSEALASSEVWRRYWLLQQAMDRAVENVLFPPSTGGSYSDEAMTTDEQREALTQNANDYHEALLQWISDLVEVAGKGLLSEASIKSDFRQHEAAIKALLSSEPTATKPKGDPSQLRVTSEEDVAEKDEDLTAELRSHVKGLSFFPPHLGGVEPSEPHQASVPEAPLREDYAALLRKTLRRAAV